MITPKLIAFVKKFVDNFVDCHMCGGDGKDRFGDACRVCGGTGKEVESYGVLFSELEPEAQALLKELKS